MSYPDETHGDEPYPDERPVATRVMICAVRHDRMARFLRLCKSNHIRVDINRGATPHETYTICRIATINGIIAQQRRGMYRDLKFADAN
jgi:hypothetical protein